MNLMFWKKKAPGDTEAEEADDRTVVIPRQEEDAEDNTVRPGLLARLRNAFAALRKPRDTEPESSGDEAETTPEIVAAGPLDGEARAPIPIHNMKKRLILGIALGAAVLLLAGLGIGAWMLLAPSETPPVKPPEAIARDTMQTAPQADSPEQRAQAAALKEQEEMRAQIEALKQQNEKMHSQIDALKKNAPDEASPGSASNKRPTAPDGQDIVLFSGKDTKESGEALKQAIDAMNAVYGGGKAHKPAQ